MVNGNAPDPAGTMSSFEELLRGRAEDRKGAYLRLVHEQKRIAVKLARLKTSIEHLNGVLQDEGLPTIRMQTPSDGGFARPGNRSDATPLRKAEWEGMSLTDIAGVILNETPEILHADVLIRRVYEIETPAEAKKAKHSFVSTLRTGAKKGLWKTHPKNRYQGLGVIQQELVGT